MKPDDRRKALLEALLTKPILTPNELAATLGVSVATIRRDIGLLHAEGLVEKVHGGVAAKQKRGIEIPYEERLMRQIEEKRAIARLALDLVEAGDSLILDGGTTVTEFARLLSCTVSRFPDRMVSD